MKLKIRTPPSLRELQRYRFPRVETLSVLWTASEGPEDVGMNELALSFPAMKHLQWVTGDNSFSLLFELDNGAPRCAASGGRWRSLDALTCDISWAYKQGIAFPVRYWDALGILTEPVLTYFWAVLGEVKPTYLRFMIEMGNTEDLNVFPANLTCV